MDVQLVKIGMVSTVLLAHKDKTGTLLQDHADAHQDQTGMVPHASAVMVEDNGITLKKLVLVHQETGTASLVFHAPPVNNGTQPLYHAHAQPTLSGTVSTVELATVETGIGITH